MNLLVTTLGTSWQIVPELLGITNPAQSDFFAGSAEAESFREEHGILPVDECWIVTTEGQKDLDTLATWAERWGFRLRIYVCKGVNTFLNQTELLYMRSLIYRAVFNASVAVAGGKLYLSLSGGRKTMSADMQEAGNLFGCGAMLHVVDKQGLPAEMKGDTLLEPTGGKYADSFTPLIVAEDVSPSFVVSADREPLDPARFPLPPVPETMCSFAEDGSLAKEIHKRKKRSSQLYANFYRSISSESGTGQVKGSLFRELYFLHPDKLRKIEQYTVGKNPEKDAYLLRKFPKAELHSHLGGVLTPEEILRVAQEEADYKPDMQNAESVEFRKRLDTILSYTNDVPGLQKRIYGQYSEDRDFFRIGIDAYQKLGGFQGSGLLQTKKTLAKAVAIYGEKLKADHVKYLELRCSPYNYTKLGLSVSDVLSCILEGLNRFADDFEYRIICIINREKSTEEIQKTVEQIVRLRKENEIFEEKISAVDLAGNEQAKSASDLRGNFLPLLQDCIRITVHAGETEDVQSIWEAVYQLNAERVGHGLRLLERKELLESFAAKKTGIELCPSSNDQIVGFRDKPGVYPLKEYLRRGLKVCLNTDDCGISRTTLSQEFLKAAELCSGLTLWDCIVLIRNSLVMAFCDTHTKEKLMHTFEDEILKICDGEF